MSESLDSSVVMRADDSVQRALFRAAVAAGIGSALLAAAAFLALGLARWTFALVLVTIAAALLAIATTSPIRRALAGDWGPDARRLRAEAGRAARRATLLAEIDAELSQTLNVESALSRVARLAVPSFSDWCKAQLSGTGGPRTVAVAEAGEQKVPPGSELTRPEQSPRRIVVPIVSRGPSVGTLAFGLGSGGRAFGPGDFALAEALAQRIAQAFEIEKLQLELQDAGESTEALLGNISHELRTPLNSIVGWATMLQAGTLEPPMRERAVATIERNAQVLARIIDVIDTARLVAGKLRIDMQPVEMASVVTAALGAAQAEALAKEIHLRTSIEPSESVVSGDPVRLRQVVTNLLAQAIKTTPKHGEIDVRLSRSNGHAEVVVRDSGAGIDAELIGRVFEGFPLAIVRQLVELHGGRIEAMSAGRGRGSTFRVTLPLTA